LIGGVQITDHESPSLGMEDPTIILACALTNASAMMAMQQTIETMSLTLLAEILPFKKDSCA
jgi:hypothetical protein